MLRFFSFQLENGWNLADYFNGLQCLLNKLGNHWGNRFIAESKSGGNETWSLLYIKASDITKNYGQQEVLKGINLAINYGDLLIMGRSAAARPRY